MIARALADAAQRLHSVSDTPRLDCELLMAKALGITRERLLLDPPAAVPDGFEALVERREAGEPVAYILGRRAFWDIELEVGPGVLVPRPDSETLLISAIEHFVGRAPAAVLDLGTGPGTLLLAALSIWREASGIGVDCSGPALAFARRNALRLGMSDRVEWVEGDWNAAAGRSFDLILCNPPYIAEGESLGPGVIEFEPDQALFAGSDGLDSYRRIVPLLEAMLAPGGLAVLEIGHKQADAVGRLLACEGLSATLREDLGGRPRAFAVSPPATFPLGTE